MQKSTNFSIEIEKNCQEMTKFPGFDRDHVETNQEPQAY